MPLTKAQILSRIIGANRTLEDVQRAFTGALKLPEVLYRWIADVGLRGEVIFVDGVIYCNELQDVGRFSRRLYYEKNAARASHLIMEIDERHRRRGIAAAHYARCLAFYDHAGIRFVHMQAAGMGPFVWPAFGFDLEHRRHRERLVAMLAKQGIEPLPDPDASLALETVDIVVDGEEVGSAALAELGRLTEQHGESLPMVLDLEDPTQRGLLGNRGILPPRDHK